MTNRLTDTELDELARLEREATERTASTWTTTRSRGDKGAHLVAFVLPASDFRTRAIAETADQEDAVFIATARNAVPRLIAEVRELRAENAYSRLSAADRELVLALPALIRESADTVRADERAKVEREIVVHHRKAVDAERIAADALRIGLEECERLRAELTRSLSIDHG